MEYQISVLRRTILFFVFVLLHFSLAFAQERKDIQIHFENDSVAVQKGSTFTNFLVIENKSSEEITFRISYLRKNIRDCFSIPRMILP
jgi:hypothetical protein